MYLILISGRTVSPGSSDSPTPQPQVSQEPKTAVYHGTNDTPTSACNVTYASYQKLQSGMTYRQVIQILGCQGQEISRVDLMGVSAVMYTWSGTETFLANMNAMFQNGRLTTKAQIGLK
jgi:hypothetical protein